jgi:hypothetical protein
MKENKELNWSIPDWTLRLGIGLPFTEKPWKDRMLCEGRKWLNVS